MKKKILFGLLAFVSAFCVAKETYQWDDLNTRKINKEAPHAFYVLSDNLENALKPVGIDDVAKIYESADAYKNLNGKWRFYFVKNPAEIKDEFLTENFDDSKWNLVDVPGTWQTQGYDRISYPNTTIEFMFDYNGKLLPEFEGFNKKDKLPPVIEKPFINEIHRQAGIYRTNFDLPKNWNGKDVFLRFGGVKSGFKLYVNGKFAGYSEDSFLPAEINVTNHLKSGKNSIAVVVYKFTTGSFFELQDMPHTMGIFRDVTALARPQTRLRDYYATANYSVDFKTCDFNFTSEITNPISGATLDVYIVDDAGKPLGGKAIFENLDASKKEIKANAKLSNFKLWSPDKPNLYKIVLNLKNGENSETLWADWGFRKYEIIGVETFLNGVPCRFKGVNRHNYTPDKGSAVDFDIMKLDCELIKRANINSIRTSHYPNDEKFIMLCSRYGIGLIDENNHETHELRTHLPAENEQFVAPSIERIENLVYRDRNVPSALIWSLGNESATYHTKSHKAMELVARKLDPTRPIHSEPGAGHSSNTSDFESPMYGGLGRMQWNLDRKEKKPFIFCEYCFAIGNGIGNLKDVWDKMRAEPSLRGGFIWDFVDRTLYVTDKNGVRILGDGRDFGTSPSAGTWCASGMIFGDRTLTPKYYEVRRVYQDIQIDAVDLSEGVFKFSNEFIGTNLNEFDLEIIVERNGTKIAKKVEKAPDLPAGKSAEIKIALPDFDKSKRGEYYLTINVLRRNATSFASKGSEFSSVQFSLGKVEKNNEIAFKGNVSVNQNGKELELVAGRAKAVFDKASAKLLRYEIGSEIVVNSPLEFDIDAAWIDNHRTEKRTAQNLLSTLKSKKSELKIEKISGGVARVKCATTYATEDGECGFKHETNYTMLASGAMEVATRITKINDTPENLPLPRVGVRMGVDKKFSNATYFGRGELQNYCDKLQAASVGLYNFDVTKEIVRYVKPQDCGNREEVRWLKLYAKDGNGFAIIAKTPLPMSILPYSYKILEKTSHPEYLPEITANELRIAWKVNGVGNEALWTRTLEKYRPNFKGSVDFAFTIMPLKNAKKTNIFNLAFPEKQSAKFEKLNENIEDKSLRLQIEGNWISKGAKVSYSSRSQYSPNRETVMTCEGENFGFHTDRNDPQQWLIIDLEKTFDLTGLIIYNRKDAQGNRTDNLIAYVSEDGKTWKQVWQTREAKPRWIVSFKSLQKARYVKLLLDKKEYFHLSGVKVYAK